MMAPTSDRSRHPSIRPNTQLGLLLVLVLVLGACGPANPSRESDECSPTDSVSAQPPGNPDRRIEDIVEYLTGERQTSEDMSVEEKIDDPNFGGVWGDVEGGVVVAVLDCSKVDPNRLAELAGGSDLLHLIEVPYTWKQTEHFKNTLLEDLNELDVEGDVMVESTITGRMIQLHVLDAAAIPESFGKEVPNDAYQIIETETVGTLEG